MAHQAMHAGEQARHQAMQAGRMAAGQAGSFANQGQYQAGRMGRLHLRGIAATHGHRLGAVAAQQLHQGGEVDGLLFGAADRGQIYVTDSTHGRILRATLGVPGLPLHRAARH